MHIHLEEFGEGNIVLNTFDHANTPCEFHTHDFIEIVYVQEGQGYHNIGNSSYLIHKGDLCVINTLTPHRFIPLESYSLKVINCLIAQKHLLRLWHEYRMNEAFPDFMSHYITNKMYDYSADKRLKNKDMSRILKLLRIMIQTYIDAGEDVEEKLNHYLIILFLELKRAIGSAAPRDRKSQIAQKMMNYLQENHRRNVSLDELAREFRYNEKYLSRLFKSVTDMTVIGYVQRIRVETAMHLLVRSDWTISDIAREVGYHDLTFFYRLFKKHTGFLPGEYRNKAQGSRKIIKPQNI